MRGITRLLAAFALTTLVFAASCAPAATPPPATQAPGSSQPTQAPPPPATAPEKVTLTVWYLGGGGPEATTVEEQVKIFAAAHPGVTIEFTLNDYQTMNEAIKLAMDSHTGPDVAYISPGYTSHLSLAKAGHLVELTDIIKERGWDTRSSVEMINYFNTPTLPHIWGIPYDLAAVGVFYNKEIFAKQGLEVPKTFGDYEAALVKLKAAGITPMSLAGADQWPIQQYWEALFEGNTPFEKLTCLEAMDRTCAWNIPTMVSSLEKLKEWVDKGYFNKDPLATNSADANSMFLKGDVAMVTTGTWVTPSFSTEAEFDAGFFPLPPMDPGLPWHVGGYTPNNVWVLPKYSTHQDLAIDLIDYMLGPEVASALWNIGDLVLYKFPEVPKPVYPLQADAYISLQGLLPGYYLGSNQDQRVQALVWPLLQEVVGGKITPQQALDKVQEEYLKYAK